MKIIDSEIEEKLEYIKEFIKDDLISLFESNAKVLNTGTYLKLNYFALGIREIMNNTINSKVNKEKLKNNTSIYPNYKPNKEDENRISTHQKLAYILAGENNLQIIDWFISVDDKIEKLYTMLRELDKFVHLSMFVKDEVLIKEKVIDILNITSDFINTLKVSKNEITNLYDVTYEGILDYILNVVIQELDELASQYYDPDIDIEHIKLIEFVNEESDDEEKCIRIECSGNISAMFQYGSDADVNRDFGGRYSYSFPFDTDVVVKYGIDGGEIVVMAIEVESFLVDTDDWYGE